MIAIFGITLGLMEIFFFSAFVLCMLVGITYDRRDRESSKWYVFIFGLLLFTAWGWKDFTSMGLSGIYEGFTSWAFWTPILYYFGFGLIYSILEFFMNIRRSAKFFTSDWKRMLGENIDASERGVARSFTLQEGLNAIADKSTVFLYKDYVVKAIQRYVDRSQIRNRVVVLRFNRETELPEPRINKAELAEHVGAWTFFWPFYLLSLVLGDLLTEIFAQVSEFLVTISGRFVRVVFKDVFKV